MALKIWMPLTTDAENNGLSEAVTAANTATQVNSGKLGRSYMFDGSSSKILIAENNLTSTMTFCLWVKFAGTGNYHIVDARGSESGYQPFYGGINYGIQIYTSNSGSNNYSADTCNFSTGVWYHLAAVITPTYSELFINGISKGAQAIACGSDEFGKKAINLGCRHTNANWFNGYMNDFRVYDEALTSEKIKEIMGDNLACHYKMSNPNIIAGKYKKIDYIITSESSYIDTGVVQTNDTAVELHIYNSSPSGNYLYGARQVNSMIYNGLYNNNSLEYNWLTINYTQSNEVYMYQSVENTTATIKINDQIFVVPTGTADANNIYIGACNNATTRYYTGMYIYFFRIKQNNEFVRNYIPVIRLSDGIAGLFDIVTQEFYSSNGASQFGYSESGIATLADCSGKGFTATGYGSPTWDYNSKKYASCVSFNSGYFKAPSIQRANGEPLTVSCWFYQTDRTGYRDLVTNRDNNNYNWMLYTHATDGSIQLHGADQYKSSVIPSLNTWHFVAAVVHTNQTYDLWLDGTKVVSAQTYQYMNMTPSHLTIGAFGDGNETWQGKLSDVRIYCTDLSDYKISEIYNTGLRLYSKGTVVSSEFMEV